MERWLSGRKRLIANPLYILFVPRVRIPLSPILLKLKSHILNLFYFNKLKYDSKLVFYAAI